MAARRAPALLVSSWHKYRPDWDCHTVQVPIAWDSRQWQISAGRGGGRVAARASHTAFNSVLMSMRALLRWDAEKRGAVQWLVLERVAERRLDSFDNLPRSMKAVLDATCTYLACGNSPHDPRKVGHYDGQLGFDCAPRVWCIQSQSSANKRAMGCRIHLHMSTTRYAELSATFARLPIHWTT